MKIVPNPSTTPQIRRVVTTFILTVTNRIPRITLFRRCDTMPTYPSHWAGISGTIEPDETPYQAAQRELGEETNLKNVVVEPRGGLFHDVSYISPHRQSSEPPSIIRVYPFVVYISDHEHGTLQLIGTEHDRYRSVSVEELEALDESGKCVPGLRQVFHHATYGKYDTHVPDAVRAWASDVENGASVLTKNAIELVDQLSSKYAEADEKNDDDDDDDHHHHHHHENNKETHLRTIAQQIAMLRPTMVPIVNVMRSIITNQGKNTGTVTVESFTKDLQGSIDLGIHAIQEMIKAKHQKGDGAFTIATFSRSGTLRQILMHFVTENSDLDESKIRVVCGRSTPGNEGELMAKDLNTEWVADATLQGWLASSSSSSSSATDSRSPSIDVLVVGADCVMPTENKMINKIGTRTLCEIAQQQNPKIPVLCCADRWKIWDDIFPPPLEEDLFEVIPLDLVSKLLVPSLTKQKGATDL